MGRPIVMPPGGRSDVFPRPVCQPICRRGSGHKPHRAVSQAPKEDIRRRDRQHGCNPGCVGTPLRKPRHKRGVPNGSENCTGDQENSQTAPAKPPGNPPCEKEDERPKDYADPKQRDEIRCPRDREVPPSGPLRQGNDAECNWAANCRACQCAHDPPRRRSRENSDNSREDKVQAVKAVELVLRHWVVVVSRACTISKSDRNCRIADGGFVPPDNRQTGSWEVKRREQGRCPHRVIQIDPANSLIPVTRYLGFICSSG